MRRWDLRKLFRKEFFACVSASTLLLLDFWERLYRRPLESEDLYFYAQPSLLHYAIPWIVVLLVALLARGLLEKTRSENRLIAIPSRLALVMFGLLVFETVRHYIQGSLGWSPRNALASAGYLIRIPAIALSLAAAILLIRHWWRRNEKTADWFCAVFLSFLPFTLYCAGLSVSRIAVGDFHSSPSKTAEPSAARQGPRVFVHVFDEWDYVRTFEEKPESYPELTRLRDVALWADNAYAFSDSTNTAIPAYLTGLRVIAAEAKGPDEYEIREESSKQPLELETAPNLFTVAKEAGHRIAILGYHHPYCRMFGRLTEQCRVFRHPGFQEYPRNYGRFLASLFQFIGLNRGAFWSYAHATYQLSQNTFANSLDLDSVSFYWSHWPFPHSPWIPKDRNVSGDYDGNLQYVDSAVKRIREELETRKLWDESVIIFTSDHPWRARPDGLHDFRVPFFVKTPHQKSGRRFSLKFNAIHLNDVVTAALKGQLTDSQDVAKLLGRYADKNLRTLRMGDHGTPRTLAVDD